MRHVFISNINYFDLSRIESLLNKNKIEFFIKSPYMSSVTAGWVTPGSSFNEKMLFVNELKVNEAKKILKKYIEDYK